ncbi:MAG: UvrB/UvrC motif-containing protein [Planctomycetota bacterium]|jgi:protein arginine kinase activator
MLCENCKKNIATVHLTEIVDDVKKEVHLCEECANDKGLSFKKQQFSLQELLGSIIAQEAKTSETADPTASCLECGMTFADFQSKGRLGCPNDYVTFKKTLVPLLEKIHGNAQHFGKVPSRADRGLATEKERMELKQKLAEAVKRENYELAADLRDRISKLENSDAQESQDAD